MCTRTNSGTTGAHLNPFLKRRGVREWSSGSRSPEDLLPTSGGHTTILTSETTSYPFINPLLLFTLFRTLVCTYYQECYIFVPTCTRSRHFFVSICHREHNSTRRVLVYLTKGNYKDVNRIAIKISSFSFPPSYTGPREIRSLWC